MCILKQNFFHCLWLRHSTYTQRLRLTALGAWRSQIILQLHQRSRIPYHIIATALCNPCHHQDTGHGRRWRRAQLGGLRPNGGELRGQQG